MNVAPKSAAEREAHFREDLKALLEKHGAEMSLEEESRPWYTIPYINVYMQGVYDADFGTLAEMADFKL